MSSIPWSLLTGTAATPCASPSPWGRGLATTSGPPRGGEDRWLGSRLNRVATEANRLMEAYLFGEAESLVHDFVWGEYCDWYVELSKLRLQRGENPLPTLVEGLETSLRLLPPFMPFVTEEIWQKLPAPEPLKSIMVA